MELYIKNNESDHYNNNRKSLAIMLYPRHHNRLHSDTEHYKCLPLTALRII